MLAGHRPRWPRGVLKAQSQGHRRVAVTLCGRDQDLLFAEGSQQTQPPPAPCLLRAEAVPWRAQLMWEIMSAAAIAGGKKKIVINKKRKPVSGASSLLGQAGVCAGLQPAVLAMAEDLFSC